MFVFLQKNREIIFRFSKFLTIGGSALLLDISLYYILTRYFSVPYLLSRSISLGVAIFWNFYLNRIWTFAAQKDSALSQFGRFLVVIGSTSLLNLFCMHVGVSILGINDIVVILCISVILTLINFIAHSFWSYAIKQI